MALLYLLVCLVSIEKLPKWPLPTADELQEERNLLQQVL